MSDDSLNGDDLGDEGIRTLTRSQAARRERILTATVALALEGGWDHVQMRAVATEAEVALGTLYRYFPSKEHLLLSVMLDEIGRLADRLAVRPPRGADPVERVSDVLGRACRALQRHPQVTIAMIRALVAGNSEVAPIVRQVMERMRGIIVDAYGEPADARRLDAMSMISDVWLASLVAWLTGVANADEVPARLQRATRLLLD